MEQEKKLRDRIERLVAQIKRFDPFPLTRCTIACPIDISWNAMKFKLINGIFFALILSCSSSFSQESIISAEILQSLLPALRNPRVMSLKDLPVEKDRQALKDFGYAFFLSEDFNRDNIPDIAVVGTFTNTDDVEDRTFVAILTKRKEKWVVDYFLRPKSTIIALKRWRHPGLQKDSKGYKSVLAQFTAGPSDDYGVIYWDGESYKIKSGFDLMAESIK